MGDDLPAPRRSAFRLAAHAETAAGAAKWADANEGALCRAPLRTSNRKRSGLPPDENVR